MRSKWHRLGEHKYQNDGETFSVYHLFAQFGATEFIWFLYVVTRSVNGKPNWIEPFTNKRKSFLLLLLL